MSQIKDALCIEASEPLAIIAEANTQMGLDGDGASVLEQASALAAALWDEA